MLPPTYSSAPPPSSLDALAPLVSARLKSGFMRAFQSGARLRTYSTTACLYAWREHHNVHWVLFYFLSLFDKIICFFLNFSLKAYNIFIIRAKTKLRLVKCLHFWKLFLISSLISLPPTPTHPLSCFLINSVFVFDVGCFVILHLFGAAEEVVWRVKAYTDEWSETVSGTC